MNRITNQRTLSLAIASLFVVTRCVPRYAPLEEVVETLDKVDKTYHPLYVKGEDGKFKLTVPQVEDVSGLKSSLAAAREDAKKEREARVAAAQEFKDIDPKKYRALMSKIDNDEEFKLISEGKHEEVWNRRTQKLQEQHKRELEAEMGKTKAALETTTQYRDRVLENSIRAAATKAEMHPQAIEDAVLLAKSVFTLDAKGNAIRLDGERPMLGADGKTPYSPTEWLEERKEDRPHWFLNGSSGGGAGGNTKGNGGESGGQTMKRSKWAALPAGERAAAAKKYKIVDD
jgi:hypothetical protein